MMREEETELQQYFKKCNTQVILFNNKENSGAEQWDDFTEVTQGQTLVLSLSLLSF